MEIIREIVRRLPLPPIMATFETTKVCNLHCTFCRKWERGSISNLADTNIHYTLNEFKEALHKLKYIRVANWMGDGEPLMNPQFNNIIELASSKGIRTTFTTNGTLVTKEQVDFWKKHKVKRITVSFDSPVPEKYESMRKGASFNKVVEACKLISSAGIYLQMNIILFKDTIEDIPEYIELCKKVGASRIYLIRPHLIGAMEDTSLALPDSNQRTNSILRQAMDSARKAGLTWYDPWFVKPYFRKCMVPFLSLYVSIGGAIKVCCYTYFENVLEHYKGTQHNLPMPNFNMGNILEEDFRKIWYGKPYKELRQLLIRSEKPLGSTIEPENLKEIREGMYKSRFSYCLGCLWRWGEAC